jgi:DNA repair protein RecO (recombination protein O)
MPALSSEAIILQHKPAGESDLLVDFLCPSLGRMKGIAKGAKKSKKRFSHCLEPLSRSRLELFEKPANVWVRIDSGDLIEPFNGIRGDFRKWGLAAFACELVQGLVPFKDPSRLTFELLGDTLEILDRAKGDPEIGSLFQLKLLQLAGYGLSFEACQACGKKGPDLRQALFLPESGRLQCRECTKGKTGIGLSPGTLQYLRQANRMELRQAVRLRFTAGGRAEIEALLEQFRRQVLGRELGSVRVLRQIQEPYAGIDSPKIPETRSLQPMR